MKTLAESMEITKSHKSAWNKLKKSIKANNIDYYGMTLRATEARGIISVGFIYCSDDADENAEKMAAYTEDMFAIINSDQFKALEAEKIEYGIETEKWPCDTVNICRIRVAW